MWSASCFYKNTYTPQVGKSILFHSGMGRRIVTTEYSMETFLIFVLRGVFNLVQCHHCHRIDARSPEIKFEGKNSSR